MSAQHTASQRFSELGLSANLLKALDRLKFIHPTPIQHQAIPVAVKGQDVIGIAQTGTGKTLAFALPMIQQLAQRKKQGLVIVPTRELAMQVDEQLNQVGQSFGLRRALLIGGSSMGQQIRQINQKPHVIIATPGRLIDHLQQKKISLQQIGVLVLDEADRMLDMGFAPQIKQILNAVPKQRQTMLFSATMPPAILKIASNHMAMPVHVEVARSGSVAKDVSQELFVVRRDQKNRLLDKLLSEYSGTVLVFSRTKHGAKKICRAVKGMGHATAEIHSNLSLNQRKRSLAGFKSGKFRVLVATDIAARGIDVNDIELVINYDLPDNLDDYVHRVGRTGRAGKGGQAISFVQPDQRDKVRLIERLVKTSLPVSSLPALPPDRPQTKHYTDDNRNHSRGYRQKPSRRSPKQGQRNHSRRARVHL